MYEFLVELENFAIKYLTCWLNAMKSDEMIDAWHGCHNWTVIHMNKILYPLAKSLGDYCRDDSCELCLPLNGNSEDRCKSFCKSYSYSIQQEYYNLDFSLYTYYEQSKWTLDYAIEHENTEFVLKDDGKSIKYKGWFDEFVKLLPLKCAKSRIIIGYDSFKSVEDFNNKLKRCFDILNDKRINLSIADSPIILIIFPRTSYINSKRYDNGLLRVHCFYKEGMVWKDANGFLTDYINDENFTDKIKKVYNNISERS